LNRFFMPLVALAAVLTLVPAQAPAATAGKPSQVLVYFTRGEQLVPVSRTPAVTAPLKQALRALVAGPTAAEKTRGYLTSVPSGTTFRGVRLAGGIATVDLSKRFESGGGTLSMRARLAQLVYTATQFPTVKGVRIALNGHVVDYLSGDGIDVSQPLRRADYAAPSFSPQPKTRKAPGEAKAIVRTAQTRLSELGYLPAGSSDGIAGTRTRHAVIAFEAWTGLPRTGAVTQPLLDELSIAERPVPRSGTGRRIEVHLAQQLVLLINGDRVVRTIHVSSGKASTPTPRGSYRVFRKELRSWSVPFGQWLPYASYFTGGIAFHEYADVPTYAASHGCVRVPGPEATAVYAFATLGTRVTVS
jgi:lipoprotein-anchoring transpeptidase ErfK/SrfK